MIPDLQALLTPETKPDVVGAALEALASLKVDVFALLVQALRDNRVAYRAATGIGRLREGTGDEEAVAALSGVIAKSLNTRPIFIALALIGGPSAIRTIAEYSMRMDVLTGQEVFWHVHGIHTRAALQRFVDAGVLDRMPTDAELAEASADPFLTPPRDPRLVWALLRASGRLLETLGTDSDIQKVARYVPMIDLFAAFTGGALVVEHVSQTSTEPDANEDSTSVVRFVAGGRAYSVTLQSHGRYYDMVSVRQVMNRALEDAGLVMRFVPLAGGDFPRYFVGDPGKITAACDDLCIPVGDAPTSYRESKEKQQVKWRAFAGLAPLPTKEELAEIEAQKLRAALPPAPPEWRPDERVAMLDARRKTMDAIGAGLGDAQLADRFRRLYVDAALESKLLDTLAVWMSHYGEEATMAGLRIVARLHGKQPLAPRLDDISLEGCVKLMAWGDTQPPAKREILVECHVDLMDPGVATFARSASDRDVIRGMLNLMALGAPSS